MNKVTPKDMLVVQSNPLIESHYKLDLYAQKLLRTLISMIKPRDSSFEKQYYRLYIKDFINLTDADSSGAYTYAKEAAKRLLHTNVVIHKKDSTIISSWIASYEFKPNMGWIEFEFSSKLEPELLLLKDKFTKYYLSNVTKLKSVYALRIYEILRQYIANGERVIALDDLKKMLGLTSRSYNSVSNVVMKVIKPAYVEINTSTDISFEWEHIKKHKAITGFRFFNITLKDELKLPDSIMNLLPRAHRKSYNLIKLIMDWINLKDQDYVIAKIRYANYRSPLNYESYLSAALMKDYGSVVNLDGMLPSEPSSVFATPPPPDGTLVAYGNGIYVVEDGVIRTSSGVIPRFALITMISNGTMRVVDNADPDRNVVDVADDDE